MVEDDECSAGDPHRCVRSREQPSRIRKRSRQGAVWESEGFIVPLMGMHHNVPGGKGPYFVHATEIEEGQVIAVRLQTPE